MASLRAVTTSTIESTLCEVAIINGNSSPQPKEVDYDEAAPTDVVLKESKPKEDMDAEIFDVKDYTGCEVSIIDVVCSSLPEDNIKGDVPSASFPLGESKAEDKVSDELLDVKEESIPHEAAFTDVVLNPPLEEIDNDVALAEVLLNESKPEKVDAEILGFKEVTSCHGIVVVDVASSLMPEEYMKGDGPTVVVPLEGLNSEVVGPEKRSVKEEFIPREASIVDVVLNPQPEETDNDDAAPAEVGLTYSNPEQQMNVELLDVNDEPIHDVNSAAHPVPLEEFTHEEQVGTELFDVKTESIHRECANTTAVSSLPPEEIDDEDASSTKVILKESNTENNAHVELHDVIGESTSHGVAIVDVVYSLPPEKDSKDNAPLEDVLEESILEEKVDIESFDYKWKSLHNGVFDVAYNAPAKEDINDNISSPKIMMNKYKPEGKLVVELGCTKEESTHHDIAIVDSVSTPSPEEVDRDEEPPTLILLEEYKLKELEDIQLFDVREESIPCEFKIVQAICTPSHKENSDDTLFLLKESKPDKQENVSAFTGKEESTSFESAINVDASSTRFEVLTEKHDAPSALGLLEKSTLEEVDVNLNYEANLHHVKGNYDNNGILPLVPTAVANVHLEENELQKKDELSQHELHAHSTEKLEIKDQRIPKNTDRTHHYDRTFLITMQSQQVCLKKPEGLPDIQIVGDSVGKLKLSEPTTNLSTTLLPADIQMKLQAILASNRKKQQKLNTLLGEINNLNINTIEKLKGAIDLIFAKAIEYPDFSPVCVSLCRCLDLLKVPANFRKLLKKKCIALINHDKTSENEINQLLKESESAKTEERKKKLKKDYLDIKRNSKEIFMRSLRFTGDLFKSKMITEYIMHYYLNKLLGQGDNDSLKHLCRLLTIIGREMELENDQTGNTHSKSMMDGYFNQMLDIVNKKQASSTTQTLLQRVIDLRLNKWIPRIKKKTKKTTKQVAKENLKKTVGSQIQNPVSICATSDTCNKQEKVRSTVQDSIGKEERKNSTCTNAKLSLNKENTVNVLKMPVHPGVNDRIGNGILPSPISLVAFPSARTTAGAQPQASAQPLLGVSGRSSSNVNKMSDEGANHQETSLPNALLKAENGANSRMDAQRDRLGLFGDYVADLLKDVSEHERRKCQSDVLKVINAYADGCAVKIDIE